MTIGNRIILLIAGLGVAWCAVWGASVLHALIFTPDATGVAFVALVVLGTIAVCVGIFFARVFFEESIDSIDTLSASAVGISAAFVFGVIAAPLAAGGTLVTPWDFLLIIGFLPMVFVVKDLLGDTYIATKNFFHNMH